MVDVLSDVLDTVRLTNTVFVRAEFGLPWGIRSRPRDHFAFHIVSQHGCWLEVEGWGWTEVAAGEAVVIAPGYGHSLRSAREAPVRDIDEMIADQSLCRPVPAGAPRTQLVCGSFRFDGPGHNQLLPVLPVVLQVGEPKADEGRWLAHTIDLLAYESLAQRPGNATVVNRLCDALFVYLVRGHLASIAATGSTWLRALDDPQIGAALQLIHEDTGRAWSVPMLAAQVSMSRSSFAARFAELVGQAPIHYLMQWRLQKAAARLRAGQSSVESVALDVGYGSVVAFSKAFKRWIGLSPGAYRRQQSAPVA